MYAIRGLTIFGFFVVQGFFAQQAEAISAGVGVRIGQKNASEVRLVIDLTRGVSFSVSVKTEPDRVIVDFPPIDWSIPREQTFDKGIIARYSVKKDASNRSQIIVETRGSVSVEGAFLLTPRNHAFHRFVLDLRRVDSPKRVISGNRGSSANSTFSSNRSSSTSILRLPDIKPPVPAVRIRPIIVIDAGHGGIDPGAVGTGGTMEKEVTLAAAVRLKYGLTKTGRYEVRLTRSRDNFMRLRERVTFARQARADLLISLHADSIKNHRIMGSSVYTLSENASDKEAELLAQRENRSDLIAGVDLKSESDDIATILIDLAQRETMNMSATFAAILMPEMRRIGKTLPKGHRFAGFAVLKAADVPSVLIEMGFLSNKAEERRLKTTEFHDKLTSAIVKAIDLYFSRLNK